MEWVVVVFVPMLVALGAFTVYRVVQSWGTARERLDALDPPRSGSA